MNADMLNPNVVDWEAIIYGAVCFLLIALGFLYGEVHGRARRDRAYKRKVRAELLEKANLEKRYMDDRKCSGCGGSCNWGQAHCRGCIDKTN